MTTTASSDHAAIHGDVEVALVIGQVGAYLKVAESFRLRCLDALVRDRSLDDETLLALRDLRTGLAYHTRGFDVTKEAAAICRSINPNL